MLTFFPSWLIILVLRLVALADPFLHDVDLLLANAPDGDARLGIASRYGGPKDGLLGGAAMACAPDYKVTTAMHVCAHRALPCGTLLALKNPRTQQRSACRVMDRGPFGACLVSMTRGRRCPKGQWRVKIRHHEPGDWRGDVDLSPAVFAELGLKGGLKPVEITIVNVPARPLKIRKRRRPTS
jgi:hypothetical protein